MEINYPPYIITDKMLNLATSIMKEIWEANYFESSNRFPELRRKTRIQSIHSSLDIETIIIVSSWNCNKWKSGYRRTKRYSRGKNAYKTYEEIGNVNPYSIEDLKKIQGILTFAIEDDNEL